MNIAERYHDISVGHRVHNHESKCRHLHGHNYRIFFKVTAPDLDGIGRVLDFSVIKERLCMWLEDNWDHKFLAWENDPIMHSLVSIQIDDNGVTLDEECNTVLQGSIVWVPFNPTAENMAEYLVNVIGPNNLEGTGCTLIEVRVEETRKCSATYLKD